MPTLVDHVAKAIGSSGATVRTRFTPAVQLGPSADEPAGQGGVTAELVGRVLKPEVQLGGVVYAPFGRPGDEWAVWAGLGALVLAFGVWAIVRGVIRG